MKQTVFISLLVLSFLCSVGCGKDRVDNMELPAILKKFTPKTQSFEINPKIKSKVKGKRGTCLIIPPKTFDLDYDDLKTGEKISVQLVEVIDNFDFITAGVSLIYYNKARKEEQIFESAGMFKVTATYKGDRLKLVDGKKITVEFPNMVPGEKFNVYKVNSSGQWEYNGHNQELLLAQKETTLSGDDYSSLSYEIKKMTKKERKVYRRYIKIRQYAIDQLTWWNFDYPHSYFTCIKGKVLIKEKTNYAIYVIPYNFKGGSSFSHYKSNFKIRYLKQKKIRLLIITQDGRIGKSRIFWTSFKYGSTSCKEGPHCYCKNSDKPIKLIKPDKNILKDKNSFMKYLNMKPEVYNIRR